MTAIPRSSRMATRRKDERSYRVLMAVAFALLLPVALVTRLLSPTTRLKLFGFVPGAGLLADARQMASAVVPFVFMA